MVSGALEEAASASARACARSCTGPFLGTLFGVTGVMANLGIVRHLEGSVQGCAQCATSDTSIHSSILVASSYQ
jgi:hypothetical protein